MRYLILFAVAYFAFKAVRNILSKVKIVSKDSVNANNHTNDSAMHLKVDESEIEDADFKEVD